MMGAPQQRFGAPGGYGQPMPQMMNPQQQLRPPPVQGQFQ